MQAYSDQCKSQKTQKKEKLVTEVISKKKSVHKVSKTLNIKYSTAKAIVKRYRETGLLSARLRNYEPRIVEEEEVKVKEEQSSVQNQEEEEEVVERPCEYYPFEAYSNYPSYYGQGQFPNYPGYTQLAGYYQMPQIPIQFNPYWMS